jgi:hypothetical protein
MSPLEQVW